MALQLFDCGAFIKRPILPADSVESFPLPEDEVRPDADLILACQIDHVLDVSKYLYIIAFPESHFRE